MLHETIPYVDRPFDTIYLDMDGVFADFHLEAIRAYMRKGRQFPELNHYGTPLELTSRKLYSRWLQINPGKSLQKTWGLPNEEFWKPIDCDPFFWANMDAYDWTKELISEVRSYCRDLIICSHCHHTSDCHSGKVKWLQRMKLYPEYDFIPCREKWRLAHKRCLLIDDHERNVDKFNEVASERGGEAFLFPAPWNRDHAFSIDPLMQVVRFLDRRYQEHSTTRKS